MSFAGDCQRFAKKTETNFAELRDNVGIALFSAVIKASPVGNPDLWVSLWKDTKGRAIDPPAGYVGGRFRANWNCSIGAIDRTTTENVDPAGSIAIATVISEVPRAKPTESIFLTNSLPYAMRLEYEGHSSQAKQGMVRLNVVRFQRIVKQQLAKLR